MTHSTTSSSKTHRRNHSHVEHNPNENNSVEHKKTKKGHHKISESKAKDPVVVQNKAVVDRIAETEKFGHIKLGFDDIKNIAKIPESSIQKRFRHIHKFDIDFEKNRLSQENINDLNTVLEALPNLKTLKLSNLFELYDEDADEGLHWAFPKLGLLQKLTIDNATLPITIPSQPQLRYLEIKNNYSKVSVESQFYLESFNLINPDEFSQVILKPSEMLKEIYIENAVRNCLQWGKQPFLKLLQIDGFKDGYFGIHTNEMPQELIISHMEDGAGVSLYAGDRLKSLKVSHMSKDSNIYVYKQFKLSHLKLKDVTNLSFSINQPELEEVSIEYQFGAKPNIENLPNASTYIPKVVATTDLNPFAYEEKSKAAPPLSSFYSMMKSARTTGAPAILAVVIAAFFGLHAYTRSHSS